MCLHGLIKFVSGLTFKCLMKNLKTPGLVGSNGSKRLSLFCVVLVSKSFMGVDGLSKSSI